MLEIILHLNQLFLENKHKLKLKTYTSILIFILTISFFSLSAHNSIITGIVLDENNIPITQVTVTVRNEGTKPNFDVSYSLELPTNNYLTLVFSYIIFINSVLIFLLSKYLDKEFNIKKKDYLIFGLFLGLIGLSRQWAFLLFPAYGYFLFGIVIEKLPKEFFNF